jgi:hypothetical protein
MTRETKIGLIVAGSFFCLICIVVASKWRHGDAPSKEPEEQTDQFAAVKPTQETNASQKKKNDASPKKNEASSGPEVSHTGFPAPTDSGNDPSNDKKAEIPGQLPIAPSFPITQPKDDDEQIKALLERKKREEDANRQTAPKVDPKAVLPPPGNFGTAQQIDDDPMIVVPPVFQGKNAGKKQIDPSGKPGALPLPAPEQTGTLPPELQLPPPSGGTSELPPIAKNTQPPKAPINEKDSPPAWPAIKPKDTVPMDPVDQAATPPDKDKMSLPPVTTLPKNANEAAPAFPPTNDPSQKPIARIGGDSTPSAPAITIDPGIGGIRSLPVVRDVNSSYVCQNGDTNFATLSKRLYGTEKYADALLAYNRDHARWIKNGSAFLGNPPSLAPGQQVEYPPIEILERSYRTLIRETSVNPVPAIPAGPLVKLATPAPLNSGIAGISNPPAIGPTRVYKVQNATGESILDIAERTLGNRSLWTEIYRINQTNPAVRPPALIPAGTDLKLPAN